MNNNNLYKTITDYLLLLFLVAVSTIAMAKDYQRAKWDSIHFKPQIETATDEQCLECHQEILDRKILKNSPAGLESSQTLAWYQTLNTYEGEQDTFHRRHLLSKYAKKVMTLKCNTCHQGNDPKDETANSSETTPRDLTQRKMVDPKICLMCHGQFSWRDMDNPTITNDNKNLDTLLMLGVTADWPEVRDSFQNNCLLCHVVTRTNRHNVNFLNAKAIEEEGKKDGDSCYGCHGGRAWYRLNYPYPRHSWPNMAKEVPVWAKDRAVESEQRFLKNN